MIIVLKPGATQAEIDHVVEKIQAAGCTPHLSRGVQRTIIGAIGDETVIRNLPLEILPGVDQVLPIMKPYKLVSREFKPEPSVLGAGSVLFGGKRLHIIAGPCAVEGREMLLATARAVAAAGATALRGGAFKPRTSPYAFQGLGEEALGLLAEARHRFGLPFVAEVLDPRHVELVAGYADLIRIGARNMSNFPLLAELGRQPKPVMLKRGFTATVEEWLSAAEYIYKEGNHHIVLCERGIRTFETQTRNTLDISAVPVVQALSHLPVMVDPSHSGGRRSLVAPLTLAALAVGADGVLIDVHPAPETALVDGPQAILPAEFAELMDRVRAVAAALGR